MSQLLFLIIAALGLLAALGTVLSRNLIHAALHLIAFFFIVACQFVMLEAEFLAAIQVLVYIGAVAILLMFAIMLTRNIQGDDTTTLSAFWVAPAVVAGLALFVVLAVGINGGIGREASVTWRARQERTPAQATKDQPAAPQAAAINNMGKAVGDEMMTRFVIPFEVAGLLLTAALVGAISLAYREGDDEPQLMQARARTAGTTVPPGARAGSSNGQGPRHEVLTPPARSI